MKNIIYFLSIFLVINSFAKESKWSIGPHLGFSFANGDHVYGETLGEGLGAKVLYNIERFEFMRLKADLLYLSYGENRSHLEGSYYNYIVKTRHESFQLTAGLHFDFGNGKVRSYLAPMAGIYNYRSIATIPEIGYYYGYTPTDTRDVQWKFGNRLEGGLFLDLGLGVLIDVGFVYQKIYDLKVNIHKDSYSTNTDDLMLNVGVLIPIGE